MKQFILSASIIFSCVSVFSAEPINKEKYNPQKHLQFMKNQGQWSNAAILYKGNYKGTQVRFLENGLSYAISKAIKSEGDKKDESATDRFEHREEKREALVWNQYFKNMNPNTQIIEKGYSNSKTNYFIGKDQSKWIRGASQYNQLTYQEIYPGIDLDYYSVNQKLNTITL